MKENQLTKPVLFIVVIISLNFLNISQLTRAQTTTKAERAVLFYFDGLHPDAIERFDLSNLQHLKTEGTTVEEAIMPFPWHPTTGAYGQIHTTSLPNPITMAGNVFLQEDQKMLQDQFLREVNTAIATGSKAYNSISPGFDLVILLDTSDTALADKILKTLDQFDPKFFRIQLQDVGRAGFSTINAPDSAAWKENIWAEGSPYEEAAREADQQLGRFISKMKELKRWKTTIFIFMADGQGNSGWHMPMDEDSWRTPLIITGPNVRKNHQISYAETIDVVPTIAFALGIDPPNPGPGSGRILKEIFQNSPAKATNAPKRMLRLNEQIKEYLMLTARLRLVSDKNPQADNILMRAENDFANGPFYGINQIMRWKEAGSIDNMLKQNERTLEYLRRSLEEVSK